MPTSVIKIEAPNLTMHNFGKFGGEGFSADDLISAWEKGKICGKSEVFSLLSEKRKLNIGKAIKFCKDSFELLKKDKVGCGGIFLNDGCFTEAPVLIVVDEKDFIKDDLLKSIKKLDELVGRLGEDLFHIQYRLMPYVDHLNEDMIIADGYTVLYNGQNFKIHKSRLS